MRARWLPVLWVLAALAAARPDVVFRAPEVLVRHAAISKPVGTRAGNASAWPAAGLAGDGVGGLQYEEFFLEHDVSTADAKKAAEALNLSLVPEAPPGCGAACSRRELEYCSSRVVGDHCCCEPRPFREPFPYLPHSCYAGSRACRPRAANCAAYTRLRDCCCSKLLQTQWKGILGGAAPRPAAGRPALLATALLLALGAAPCPA